MTPAMESFLEKIKKGIAVSKEKIDEYSHIGKVKLDILGAKRTIDRLYRELGKRVYQMIEMEKNAGISNNEVVLSLTRKITVDLQRLADLEMKMQELSDKQKQKS
jgi:hypothetical protein